MQEVTASPTGEHVLDRKAQGPTRRAPAAEAHYPRLDPLERSALGARRVGHESEPQLGELAVHAVKAPGECRRVARDAGPAAGDEAEEGDGDRHTGRSSPRSSSVARSAALDARETPISSIR